MATTSAIPPKKIHASNRHIDEEQRYALALEASEFGVWDWDLSSDIIYYSPVWMKSIGISNSDIETSPKFWFDRVHPEDLDKLQLEIKAYLKGKNDHFKCEYRIRHQKGYDRVMLSQGIAIRDKNGKAIRFVGTQVDITEEKREDDRLIHDAMHDILTDLPNRALFMDRLRQAILSRVNFAVLYMDIDHFKDVNDTLGHEAGDELLGIIARRIEGACRAGDTIARLGGDEFCVLVTYITKGHEVESLAVRILQDVAKPIIIDEKEITPNLSIGIALGSSSSHTQPQEVLKDADIALYEAKGKGRGRYKFFHDELMTERNSLNSLEMDLRKAIQKEEISIYYQPIVSLKTGQIVGLESLLRWQHPKRGLLPADEFMTLAEDRKLIVPLGEWAVPASYKQLKDLQNLFPNTLPPYLAINLSNPQILDPNFLNKINELVKTGDINPASIQFEIGERVIIADLINAEKTIMALHKLGCKIALDDFGTGYTSLSYLHRFPFDAVKLDQSLLQKMNSNQKIFAVIKGLIFFAKSLDINVIAEGVESKQELDTLLQLGCDSAQGYYFSKPLPFEEIKEMVSQKNCMSFFKKNPSD